MKKRYFIITIKISLILIFIFLYSSVISAQVNGTVFKDFNGDGIQQIGEPGKDRVEVYAYSNATLPNKDILVAQTITNANGQYSIISPVYPIRLEFVVPDGFCNMSSTQDYPSANLTLGINASEIQIAKDGEIHNFGIVYPSDFSIENNPRTFVTKFFNGDGLVGGSTSNSEAVVSFNYNNNGVAPNDGRGLGTGDNIPFETIASQSQVGASFGMAYSRQAKKIFVSAFLKRHAGMGPLGSGGIYWMNPEPPYDLNANLEFCDLDDLGFATNDEVNPFTSSPVGSMPNKVTFSPIIGDNIERGLSGDKIDKSYDRVAWTQVGKLSFGDLEISEDGRYLYVVNLYDRKLYEIDLTDPVNPVAPTIANAAMKIHGYQIPNPCGEPVNGEYRPFALKVTRGKVFVGVTCSGQDINGNTVANSNVDVKSSIFEFDLNTHSFNIAPIIEFDYSYRDNDKPWNPWTNEWDGSWENGYPLLSDIEFDNNGNILMGIMDLRGNQMGHANYSLDPNSTSLHSMATVGDLLRAERNATLSTCSYNIQFLPEFYDDHVVHSESSQGMLAVHHTSDFDGVMSTFLDPIPSYVWAGGVMLYNNQNGNQEYGDGYEIFYSSNSGLFGKANGLGDIETMEVIPPIEIGNMVWLDKDKDGIQDSDEEGIAGVLIELVKNGMVVSTTTTDNLGTYYFNFTNTNNGEGPEPNTNYKIRISNTQFNNGTGSGPLYLKGLTQTNEIGNGKLDWSDNDALEVGGVVQISLTTGNQGENNHSYDFGFYPKSEIGNYVWEDMNANGIQDDGDTGINGVEVKLYNELGQFITSTITSNDPVSGNPGYYLFSNIEPGDYFIEFIKGLYLLSPQDQGGNEGLDSDVNQTTGLTVVTTLDPGESDMSWDAGLFELSSLGDFVWMDKDENGIQGIDEYPLKNVVINLYKDTNLDGTPDGLSIAQTQTDNNGFYEFIDLIPGNYIVEFIRPPGYKTVSQNQGGNDMQDSDYNENTYLTGTINLESGEHDPSIDAGFKVRFDLALKKLKPTLPAKQGEKLVFDIQIFNQSEIGEDVQGIEITDYINLDAYEFISALNPGWVLTGNKAKFVYAGILAAQTSDIVQITLMVKYGATETQLKNEAEISRFEDLNGEIQTEDKDSTPDDNPDNDNDVECDSEADDNIDGNAIDNPSEDEDDNDISCVDIFDLALTKKSNAIAPFGYGEEIEFTFEVTNQGNMIAYNIEVIDYIPMGYGYFPHLNLNWTQSLTKTPKTTIPGPLLPGESISVNIQLVFQYTIEEGGYTNVGEISGGYDDIGRNMSQYDWDGYLDDIYGNDAGGNINSPNDDCIEGDGRGNIGDATCEGDEDDEDPWGLEVASIGDYVWYDNNDNGIQDDGTVGEVGVEGVLVVLRNCTGDAVLNTLTDENGHYEFKNLIPGDYMVTFDELPSESEWAKQNVNNNAMDSDTDANGVTTCTTLDAGEDDPTWDAGILRYSTLGDYVWLDTDKDGVQDPNEDDIEGVVVRLLNEVGDILATTTTDENGYYKFDSLHPGIYIVEFVTPDGLTLTGKGIGGDGDIDSDVNIGTGRTDSIILGSNENRIDIDAGFKCGLNIELSSSAVLCTGDTFLIEATIFEGTSPITYNWSTGEDTDEINVNPVETTVYSVTVTDINGCEGIKEVTISVDPKAKIGDYVWFDKNHNGIQDFFLADPDLSEHGLNGVTVNLYSSDDANTILETQLTHIKADTSGYYEFNVCSGDYFVEFIAPTGSGYIFTTQDKGLDDGSDSDADEVTGRTISTHLEPGEEDNSLDAGFYKAASIGDYVWYDADVDGIQDQGEEGVDGVIVSLHKADGSFVESVTTIAGGKYDFVGLDPGDYYVCFDYSQTTYSQVSPQDEGFNDELDSDVDPDSGCTEITEIIAGENDVTWDMGLYSLASLGDYVWLDKDADGVQDADESGILGVIVRLFEDADANGIPDGVELGNVTTNGVGFYEFTGLEAGTYVVKFEKPTGYKSTNKNVGADDGKDSDGDLIFGYSDPIELSDNDHDPTIDQGYYETVRLGDYVWFDKDGDGVQDVDEEGVSGVTVTLYKDEDGDGIPETAVQTKVTNTGTEEGKYLFEEVDPGVYIICFDTDGDYDGYTQSTVGADRELDSNVDQATGCTEVIVVESGDEDISLDAGLIKTAELGDYVWEDTDADGFQDPTESPIAGIMVILKDGAGVELDTTYTDAGGFYKFEDLLPGDYIVHFESPLEYKLTNPNLDGDDTKDSDVNVVSEDSHLVTLEAGDSDMTIDAGYYKPASMGDYVWEDKDVDGVQDADENGINGIEVTLYDDNGDPISNTITGVDGYYDFTDLEPGTYHVCFDKGDFDNFTEGNVGTDDTKNSDADPLTGCTETIVLESGENDPTWDAGLYDNASLGNYVWLDLNVDGNQEESESGINGIEVKLYADTDGDGNTDGVSISSTTTTTHLGKNGYYIFEDLKPGNYIVFFPTVDAYELTEANTGDDTKDSDADKVTGLSHSINLESGEFDQTIDAGVFNTASLGDYVWFDEDGDGIQDASEDCMNGVTVNLFKVNNNAGILDTVYIGSEITHIVVDETGIIKCGYYEFERLVPGDYFLVFENPDNTEYQISPNDNLFDDLKDSDPNEYGNTPTLVIDPGENNTTIDAGFYIGECLSGELWQDNENPNYYEVINGLPIYTILNVHDIFDTPLTGIIVELYSIGVDEYDASDDELLQTVLTNENGEYNFSNLKQGKYFLVISLPDTLTVVNNDVGNDVSNDNDFYYSNETGLYRSHPITITPDNDATCVTGTDGGTKTANTTQPIDLVSFNAVWNELENIVVLNWETTNEINIENFEIERRAENEDEFNMIDKIKSKGRKSLSYYRLKDANVEMGMRYYYRLKPIDENGIVEKVYLISIFIPANKLILKSYPNPVIDKVYVVISGEIKESATVKVLDHLGKEILAEIVIESNNNLYDKISFDLSDLPQGQYFIRLVTMKEVKTMKIIHVK